MKNAAPRIPKLAPIRKARARTAWDLCRAVCAAILEEPKRYDQSTFCSRYDAEEVADNPELPACGTIACRAGWIVALHDGGITVPCSRVETRAQTILGTGDTTDLFDIAALFFEACKGCPAYARSSPQRRNAQKGVWGLRQWMKTHEAQLKARLLKDVPELSKKERVP